MKGLLSVKFQLWYAHNSAGYLLWTLIKLYVMLKSAATIKVVTLSLMAQRKYSLLKNVWLKISSLSFLRNLHLASLGYLRSVLWLKAQADLLSNLWLNLWVNRRLKLEDKLSLLEFLWLETTFLSLSYSEHLTSALTKRFKTWLSTMSKILIWLKCSELLWNMVQSIALKRML